MADRIDYRLRPACETDRGFVAATWTAAYWARPLIVAGREVPRAVGKLTHAAQVWRMIPHLDVIVAHVPNDPDALLGWIASSGTTLHFVYARDGARQQGIARALLEGQEFSAITHWTADAPYILRITGPLPYDPFIWGEVMR